MKDQMKSESVGPEKAKIEKRMKEDRAGYFSDNAMQARYRDLVARKGA